jgi:hypothetical protein
MKYILIHLQVQNGEYRYDCKSVHQTKCKNIYFAGERHAAGFYGGLDGRNGEWWEFNGGEVAVRCSLVHELTKQEYEILNKYL